MRADPGRDNEPHEWWVGLVNFGLQFALFKAEVFGWEESEMLHHLCDTELSLSSLGEVSIDLLEWGKWEGSKCYFTLQAGSKSF